MLFFLCVCDFQFQSLVLSGSMDCTIRLWHVPSSQPLQILRAHDGAITGLSLHATGDYILSSSMDQYWAFSDFRTGTLLAKVVSRYLNASILFLYFLARFYSEFDNSLEMKSIHCLRQDFIRTA